MADDHGNSGKGLRSRRWFDNPHDPALTALYVERYLNYGTTREELQGGKPIDNLEFEPAAFRCHAADHCSLLAREKPAWSDFHTIFPADQGSVLVNQRIPVPLYDVAGVGVRERLEVLDQAQPRVVFFFDHPGASLYPRPSE